MRQRPDEQYADWVERVRTFELAEALKEIRNGADINLVMEAMSARIMKKLLHPLLIAIRESNKKEFDIDANRKTYSEAMGHRKPIADHVVDEEKIPKNIDKDW
jgi:glutamyl-tRNA reductase